MIRRLAVRSGAAQARLDAVAAFLAGLPPSQEVVLVAASRGAADDCARAAALTHGVSFGVHRFSVTQIAARLAVADLAAAGRTPITALGYEALVTRATFDASREDALSYLRPVRETPGFPRALAATLTELRLQHVDAARLAALPRSGSDLADLVDRLDALLDEAGAGDRAALFDAAITRLDETREFAGVPVVLLDVPFDSAVTSGFLLKLVARAPQALITIPAGDAAAVGAVTDAGFAIEDRDDARDTDLTRLHHHLFAEQPPPERERTGELVWLSAPGEARECVEIARRILKEAAAGVRFDEMAVLLRSPEQYAGLLEHAFDRAGIAAHFDRGTHRPDPAGRAFLALLACAIENLSATRFAEYLSLAQVPTDDTPEPDDTWVIPDDEGLGLATPDEDGAAGLQTGRVVDDNAAGLKTGRSIVTAPWRWERLLVDSAVIGGADRWQRRLDGLAAELGAQIRELQTDDPDDPRIDKKTRDLESLAGLQAFVLPIVEAIAEWPERASWGEWLGRLSPFARRVLRQPDRVLQVLAGLAPMAGVGLVTLEEVRDVLAERLGTFFDAPSMPRYGKVFVAATAEARGRAFKVVFVPGVAERLFPRAIHEDPLLADDLRAGVPGLLRQDGRAARERLWLRLAVGAATDRVYVSFPRVDATGGRARVPSFYALELMRAVTGIVPDYQLLADDAAETSDAMLAWPAPRAATHAIDDFEHDLSVLRSLMRANLSSKGRAHYIVQLNPHLRRSLTAQWNRARSPWTFSDGIVRATDAVKPFLTTQRLGARAYSVSALQHYAACPYRFLLSAIYRFAPLEEPVPLQKMDPLTRGSLFHQVQADLFRALQHEHLLPPKLSDRDRILRLLDRTLEAVATEFAEQLAPAIDRVWRDEIAALGRDLHVWIDEVMHDGKWEPWRFELAFGLRDQTGRDEHSLRDPVTIDGRFQLRGSIDLVEKRRTGTGLRVTDYKTGRNRSPKRAVLGGGTMLQPVIYSLAVEAATKLTVETSRYWYCTTAGSFAEHDVPITDRERRAGIEVLEIVDRAVELGVFPAAPAEKACTYCDFRRVCGPDEERRSKKKARELLGDLDELRARP
jgi:CRISPR/Cas system-associated exonuclease Cas4 (RecB family)